MCTFVGVLHHYIGIWAHFELCPGLFPMWFELLPLHTTYTLMHLDVLYVFVWAHFELDFEVSSLEFELSHAQKKDTSTYVYLCWCSSSLHRYLSSLWALPWAFSNVIWAAAFTYYIYLDASWCPICVCLSSFWAWFWVFPTGIWAIPCTKNIHKHMCTFVGVLHHYIGIWAHFELCLGLFPMWFELLPPHTTYTLASYTCSSEPILSLILSFPHWNLSCPTQNKMHKHTCTFVDVLHHYMDIWDHLELCLELCPMWFELLPLHTTYTLMHLDVLYVFVWAHFELDFEFSPLEFELSHAQKKWHKHTCSLVEVLHRYTFELILSSVLILYHCDLSCCLHIQHISWCPMHVCLISFWAWFWALPTGIWAVPVNIRVPLLMFFTTTWIFELILNSVLGVSQCNLSCFVYVHRPGIKDNQHISTYSYIIFPIFSIFAFFFPNGLENSLAKSQWFSHN